MRRVVGILMTLALLFFAVRWGSVVVALGIGVGCGYLLGVRHGR